MFDYIVLAFLFFLGSLAKLIFLPLYFFRTNTTFNTSLQSMGNRIIYYMYVLINYLLTFVLGSFLVANQYTKLFIFLWIFLIALDISIFVIFYNKSGNSLGSPVGFVILVRDILFTLISLILMGVYFSADYESQMTVYGGIIWGLASAKIIDAFPKFYIFDKEPRNTLNINKIIPSVPLLTGSIINAMSIILLAIIGSITGFTGSTTMISLLAVVYVMYVAGYLMYIKFN